MTKYTDINPENADFDIEINTNTEPLDKKFICKNERLCLVSKFILSFLSCIGIYLIYLSLSNVTIIVKHNPDSLTTDDFLKEKDISTRRNLRIMGHYHKTRKCSDYKYGCCEIYYGCNNDNYLTFTISPYRIVKHDESGSNCPSLNELVNRYNEMNPRKTSCRDSDHGCCKLNTQCDTSVRGHNTTKTYTYLNIPKNDDIGYNCLSPHDLIVEYQNYWIDGTLDSVITFIVIVAIICFCCFVQEKKYK
jgi:hypothetical protein